ncbi:LysR family transcriptional regulator [Sphingobium nicotianae]|uniref:LysR family transcriptional regulator n=1 Tax=Sphingobium nicotianae TaxID=2782607 RepID=A0A9X1DCL0_9SPHN|nr:LysR family transcriptional regulator [Sphingobium nicotianae]MBT2187385.1 LysR family transcriptional regulator [Sphingobium nicotianae]
MTFERHLLAAFQAVAEHGTVGRAAKALHAAQPTISRYVRALEEQFGHALFDRDSRGMHLTPAGADLLPRVHLLLYEMAAAQDLMDAHRGLKRGAIRIGGVTAISRAVFPAVLARVAERAPGLRVEVMVASEDQLDRALANRDIDIMFATDPPREVEAVRIGTRAFSDRCAVFCGRSHPILADRPVSAARALREQWALPGLEATPRRQFESLVRQAGFDPPSVALETDSVELILAVVARSSILSWFPEPLLPEALGRGDIVILPVPDLELARTFSMYRRSRGTFPASAQIFIDALGEAARA